MSFPLRGSLRFYVYSGRERLGESDQFQEHPEALLSPIPFYLRSSRAEWNVSIPEKIDNRDADHSKEL